MCVFSYSQRSDCGSLYKLWVELLHEEGQPVQVFYPETMYINNGCDEWNQVCQKHKKGYKDNQQL